MFLENELASFALSIPANIRINKVDTKYLIKRINNRYFPKSYNKPKKGFILPISQWIDTFFIKNLNIILTRKIEKQNIFNSDILISYIDPMLNKLKKIRMTIKLLQNCGHY